MKAVILTRVSSEEQEEGHSISAQKQRLIDYCDRRNLEIAKIYEIVESSTRGERKEFTAMMQYALGLDTTVAFISDKIDRFQRSHDLLPELERLRKAGRIELHFCSDNRVVSKDSNANDLFIWHLMIALSANYTNCISDNVKRSFQHKVLNGEWCGPAPYGYLNTRNQSDKADIIICPVEGQIVKQIFERYSTGYDSALALSNFAKANGLNISKSQILHLLQNPFYYGLMRVKGTLTQHRYEPLISKQLFDQCEAVRSGKVHKPGRIAKIESALRGLIRCAVTGKAVTPEVKLKLLESGKKITFHYLRTYNPNNTESRMYVSEEAVLKQIGDNLSKLVIPEEAAAKIRQMLGSSHEAEKRYHESSLLKLRREESELQRKLERLTDALIEGHLLPEEHNAKKRQLKNRQIEIIEDLKTHQLADDGFREGVSMIIGIMQNAKKLFEGSTSSEKRQILNLLYSNLSLRGAKLELALASPFDLFAKTEEELYGSAYKAILEPANRNKIIFIANFIRPLMGLRRSV